MENIIYKILNEMADYLNIDQQKKLQQVLVKKLADNKPTYETVSNGQYRQMFLDAKKIEGCSARTI